MENSELFSELWATLSALVAPIVATIVSTIMGTEIVKRVFPNLRAETVTWIVYALLVIIIALVINWIPGWLVLALGLLASGVYSQVIKLPIKLFSNRKSIKDPPVGGGGSGPIP